ncbi:MAG: ATP-binding cassette domain-containing protein [Oscillospiraceae bacterium]|nr:ATP-binding cassette domain-containing protein [Oscillospiraceae bacterium]
MAAFAIEHLTFTYPKAAAPALDDVSFSVREGEFFLLCGVSGGGKSTLLRHLKSVLTPYGTRSGQVLLDGKPLETWDARTQAQRIGFVLQQPDDQLVTDKVWHELAFGLESLGTDTQTMRLRVGEMASFFGIQTWFDRDVDTLSGGQKQLLNLASVMAMHPDVLVLDEPTGQLDPIAAAEFLHTVQRLNRELGVTVILSEHRLEDALPMADRAAVLEQGRLTALGTPDAVARTLLQTGSPFFAAMPTPVRVWGGVGAPGKCPLDIRAGRALLETLRPCPLPAADTPAAAGDGAPLLQLRECRFRYDRDGADVLKGLSLTVHAGELLAIVGGNGAGKSTALAVLAGQRRPYRGKVLQKTKRIAALCQEPRAMFVKDTVRADLEDALRTLSLPVAEQQPRMDAAVAAMALSPLLERHPFDLSGGEQQRAAIAKLLLARPDVLLLDEPTKGMDAAFRASFGALLRALCAQGTAVVLVSHDIEFCAAYAGRAALLFDGQILSEGRTRAFFAGNHFYTTAANRMARPWLPDAILCREVIEACRTHPEASRPTPVGADAPPLQPV